MFPHNLCVGSYIHLHTGQVMKYKDLFVFCITFQKAMFKCAAVANGFVCISQPAITPLYRSSRVAGS